MPPDSAFGGLKNWTKPNSTQMCGLVPTPRQNVINQEATLNRGEKNLGFKLEIDYVNEADVNPNKFNFCRIALTTL